MKTEIDRVLYELLFRVNRALDAIAAEALDLVEPELVLAAERLTMARALWREAMERYTGRGKGGGIP